MVAAAALLGLSTLVNQSIARQAEHDHAPHGSFITVDGVRLHFIDTGGSDPVLVLLHGNGAMIDDMEISGLVRDASKSYRVIVFDRPGFGYSERPSDRIWGRKRKLAFSTTRLRRWVWSARSFSVIRGARRWL